MNSFLTNNVHGVGLRPTHYTEILENKPAIGWFEVITENYLDSGGKPLHTLEKIRQHYPIALHGVSLSIGSTDEFSSAYFKRWKDLIHRIEPFIVSDHLCWTSVGGHNSHDLLPLPFTQETLEHVVRRVSHVQDFLQRVILIENVSSYVTYQQSEMAEWEFLTQLSKRSGCKLLLDVNNVYVNAFNHSFQAQQFLDSIPKECVGQFHLAGHTNMGSFLFDTHNAHVIEPVWELYRKAVVKFGKTPTLVEWDDNIPKLETLLAESNLAKKIMQEVLHEENMAVA